MPPTVPGLAHLPVALSPTVLTAVLGAVATVGTPDQPLPVATSRTGSIFTDRFDPTLRWYLPQYSLAATDPAFAFAAKQQGVQADSGQPFDVATIVLTLTSSDPADVIAARTADPTLAFRAITPLSLQVALSCPSTGADGSAQPLSVPLTTTTAADGSLVATASLVGPAVVVAYQDLAGSGTATVDVTVSFAAWRIWQPVRLPPIMLHPVPLVAATGGPVHLASAGTALHRWPVELGDHVPPVHVIDAPDERWVTVNLTDTQTLATDGYRTDAFRSRYTIDAGSGPRPIVDANDLLGFAQSRSEFRELTSLGDISARYPSLRRAYLGQVSGTVVAVPQSYGIHRDADGLAALVEAVADDSATARSGCRFELSFTLAPAVDPVDLALLAHDLSTAPEAAARPLQLVLPDSLDPRFPSLFTGFPAATSTVGDGARAGTVQVHVQITDTGDTPAICNANLFLHQLASRTAPMTGSLAVRLDDVYPTAVTTAFTLALDSTAGTDDVSLTAAGDGSAAVVVHDVGPFSLHVGRAAALGTDGPHCAPLDVPLEPDATSTLPAVDGLPVTLVHATLALPDPVPPGGVFDYLSVHTETVTSVQHSLLYSASLDLAAAGIAQLDVTASLVDLPTVPIPAVTLTPLHTTDSVHAVIPIDAIVTGLTAQVRVLVTAADASTRTIELTHDFVADPLLTFTTATFG